jgi:hypothetical protein
MDFWGVLHVFIFEEQQNQGLKVVWMGVFLSILKKWNAACT